MVIVGVLLILAVLLDAYRRVRSERRAKTRVSMTRQVVDTSPSAEDEELLWLKELPNGGSRVVERGDIIRATNEAREKKAASRVAETNRAAEATAAESEPGQAPQESAEEFDLLSGINSLDEPETLDWLDGVDAQDLDPAPAYPQADDSERLPRVVDPEVFMVNVVSRDTEGFRGEDILHILLACDLRFGDMSFFHRHEQEAGRGPIQFSVANMVQPGVFDIDDMTDMNTPGLVFFLTLPGAEDMMQAFDYMLETAQAVARNLRGDVLDESRSVITRQTLDHCRQKIRDLERRMLTTAAR
ncbi:MAG: cell division protein ZipA [Halioglobus sp.]